MDCSLKTGMMIDSGSSAARDRRAAPEDTLLNMLHPSSDKPTSIRNRQSRLSRPDLAILQIPAPRRPQASLEVGRGPIAEFTRRFGDIAPGRVHLTAAAPLVTDLEIASGEIGRAHV